MFVARPLLPSCAITMRANDQRRTMANLLPVLLVTVLLSGCATPYQRQGFLIAGYSETQLAGNVFQVSFQGNQNTGRERASDFALLRSAEVTAEHGFRYFIVVESVKDSSTNTMYGNGNPAYGLARTSTYGNQTFVIQKPRPTNTILCFKEKPDIVDQIFEAEFVKTSLKQKYGITD